MSIHETPALAGRIAVVTGASRGIGLAAARAIAAAGGRVAMLARGAGELAARAEEIGGVAIPCDVADARAVEGVATTLADRLGGDPEILVNNAGVFRLASVEETDGDALRATLDVNLVAPFLLARALVPAMRARGRGHVVNVGSIADHTTFPENGAYAASKHALRAFHDVLRAELRGTGVRASLVSPGPVDTPLWDPVNPDAREGFTRRAMMLPAASVGAAIVWVLTQPPEVCVDLVRLSRT